MEFRLLGEPQVDIDGTLVDLGTPKQRVVLVALVLAEGQPVLIHSLMERVWEDHPPPSCRNLLATYVSRLRRCLARNVAIIHRSGSYVLYSDQDAVDLVRFRRYTANARRLAGRDDHTALDLYECALALWRGPALAGLPGRWIADAAAYLEGEYRDVQACRVQALVHLGRYEEAADAASRLVIEFPLDERFTAQLIEAFGATGRTSEAIEHYHTLRVRLANELGVDPSIEVQESYLRLLRTRPAGSAASVTTRAGTHHLRMAEARAAAQP